MKNDEDSVPSEAHVSEFAVCTFRCRLEDEDDDVFSEIVLSVSHGEVSIKVTVGTLDMGLENSRCCLVKHEELEKLVHVCEDLDSGPVYPLPITTAEFSAERPKPILVDGRIQIALDGALGFRDWLPVHLKTVMMLAEIYGVDGYRTYREPDRAEPKPEAKPRKDSAVN